jgi:hypothetical protein
VNVSKESVPAERLRRASSDWQRKKQDERKAMAQVTHAIRAYIAYGGTEVDAARIAGVTRTTVRRAVGKA